MQRIAVVDYGMGNLHSVSKALETVAEDAEVVVSSDAAVIDGADRVVCPGQGAARDCMAALDELALGEVVVNALKSRPFLGICMGLQVLMSRSDENGGIDCLDVIAGGVHRFPADMIAPEGDRHLKIPHMGWNQVQQKLDHPLWEGIPDESRFYFVHSYYVDPADDARIAGSSHHGMEFPVALQTDLAFACQFHPEKSADAGLRLLKNFTEWA